MRTAFAVEQRRVFLRRIEIGRQDYPRQHLFAVGGFHPAFLDFAKADLVEDRLVDERELRDGSVFQVDFIEFRGRRDRADIGYGLAVCDRYGVDVVIAPGQYGNVAVHVHAAELVRSLHRREEPKRFAAVPDDVGSVVVEILREFLHQARFGIPDHQTLLVGFIARTTLRTECDFGAVGREYGVFVVADERQFGFGCRIVTGDGGESLADVGRGACLRVIDENVRVGRNGVFRTCQRFAGVCESGAVRSPRDFGHIEIGCQRSVPLRTFADDVHALPDAAGGQLRDEDVAVFAFIPAVPVAAHQVVVNAGFRFGHVRVDVGRLAVGDLYALYIKDFVTRRIYAEPFDVLVEFRKLAGILSVGSHFPDLRTSAAVGQEVDLAAVGIPFRIGVVRREVGQLGDFAAGGVTNVDRRNAPVLLHIVPGDGVEQPTGVGRERGQSYAAHFPHHFGRENAGGDLLLGERVVDSEGLGALFTASAESHERNCHKEE